MTAIDAMDTTGLEASGGADHKAGDSMDNKLETTRADSEPGDRHEGDRQDERDDATGLKASSGADHKDNGSMDDKLETTRADSKPPVGDLSDLAASISQMMEMLRVNTGTEAATSPPEQSAG